ncbi:MAG: PCRF domain-containing protein, partial [Bacteroidales bacterium]|nr:PCRF domain-containing protein [Bacteroidales bacterium]
MNSLLEKLEVIYSRWLEIGEQLVQPETIADMKRFVKLNKDYKELQAIVNVYQEYKNVLSNISNAKEVIANEKDEEFRNMAKEELNALNEREEILENQIRLLLIPSDPQDEKNAIVEIRAGTGGDEASIFAGDLFRMYSHYCENKKWKLDVV